MNELTESDYLEILNGGRRAHHYSGDYYIVSRKKTEEKPTQKQVLLKGLGLPATMNDEYDEEKKQSH